MRILVIGSGGREYALCLKLKESPEVKEIFCAPGNGGISQIATCVPIQPEDIAELGDFAQKLQIDLTVVGPELPLMLGIVDEFQKRGLNIFGPSRLASEIEGSKVFAKQFMERNGIPTPGAEIASSEEEFKEIVSKKEFPYVLKADGLAQGKGVYVIKTKEDLEAAHKAFFKDKKFGNAASRVLVEEFLEGEEVSFMVISDGSVAIPLASSKDYKRLGENDTGPNTGGMGSHSPAVILDKENSKKIMTEIMLPAISSLSKEGREYRGVLYAGLMLTQKGPYVLEFNARFGDPETQSILLRMESDLLPILYQASKGKLQIQRIEWKKEATACIVLASKGYPEFYEKGFPIEGIEEAQSVEGVTVIHAGTVLKDGVFYTNGGRVLNVCANGQTLAQAIGRAYLGVKAISFENKYYRSDIGQNVLKKMHYA
ncbi:MAG: phosphoribosylamine--glycine ligase [Thermoanaerobaculia bacterium]